MKGEESLECALEMAKLNNIQLDLVCYNMIMDFYCSTEKFVKA